MEVLTIIQGVMNLLELSSLAFKLCRRFKDAPKDLELVGKHLNWLAAEIHILVELQENPLEGIFKAKETHMLFCETLLEAKRTLASVHDTITEYARKNSIGTKLHSREQELDSCRIARLDKYRIQVQLCPVKVIETPEQILCGSGGIISTAVVWEIVLQGRPTQLCLEFCNIAQHQYDGCPHKPSGVYDRVKEDEGL